MSQPAPSGQERPRWTAVSIALIVIGLLVFIPASLCTVAVMAEESSDLQIMMLVLAFGGVPAAAGAALVYAGYRIGRGPKEMAQPSPSGQGRPRWTAASIAFFVLGLLILVPSGLCTALLGGSIIAEGVPNGDFSGFPIVLIYGGLPIAMGAALVYAAFHMRRRD